MTAGGGAPLAPLAPLAPPPHRTHLLGWTWGGQVDLYYVTRKYLGSNFDIQPISVQVS
jgi:hypothetical protein